MENRQFNETEGEKRQFVIESFKLDMNAILKAFSASGFLIPTPQIRYIYIIFSFDGFAIMLVEESYFFFFRFLFQIFVFKNSSLSSFER